MSVQAGSKPTRRRLLAGSVATGTAAAMAALGCGTGRESATAGKTADLTPARIMLWHHFGGARIPLMEELGRRVTTRYPQVSVESLVFDINSRVEKILTAASADGLPDVLMINRRDLPQYGPMNFLLPLGDYARRDRIADNLFYEAEIKACYDQNRLLTLPMVTAGDWQFIYYNRDPFRRLGLDLDRNPPRNWNELRELAVRLTQRTGDQITQLGYTVQHEFAFQHFISNWLALGGGTFLDKSSKKVQLDRPEAAAALEYLTDTVKALGGIDQINAFQRASGNPHPLPIGKLAMESRGTPWWFTFKAQQPQLDLGIFITPAAAGKPVRFGAGDGWSYSLPRSSKTPEQAWRVLHFFTMEEEGAGAFVLDQLRPSPVKKLNENPEYKKQHPQWNVVLEMLAKNEAWVWLPVHDAITTELQPMLNEVRDGKTAPRAALSRMQEAAQRRVDEYWKTRA